MIDTAKQANRLLSIGYHLRYHPLHQQLRAELASGQFGRLMCLRAQSFVASQQSPSLWRQQVKTSGGWALGNMGTHLIDWLRWCLGEVIEVQGILARLRFKYETEDYASLSLRFEQGTVGTIEVATAIAGAPPRLEIYGTEGYCIGEATLFGGGSIYRGKPLQPPEMSTVPIVNLYQRQVEAFGKAIRGLEPLLVTANDGLENVIILEKARKLTLSSSN